ANRKKNLMIQESNEHPALRSSHQQGDLGHSPQHQTDAPRISIIIPTLNESDSIGPLLRRINRAMHRDGSTYEVIIVDDHSTDDTISAAQTLAARLELPVLTLLKQGKPGKSYSLLEGFAAAQADILGMIDGDLQYPPEKLPEMLAQLREADIVVGDRRATYMGASRLRGALSRTFSSAIGEHLLGMDTDVQSGLKIFRRAAYEQVKLQPTKWGFDVELLSHLVYRGYRIANIPIDFQQRFSGVSKVSPMAVGLELLGRALQLRAQLFGQDAVHAMQRWGVLPQVAAADAAVTPQPEWAQATTEYAAEPTTQEIRTTTAAYASWLTAHATQDDHEEVASYVEAALEPVEVGGQQMHPFAPIQRYASARRTFTRPQLVTLAIIAALWVAGLFVFHTGV